VGFRGASTRREKESETKARAAALRPGTLQCSHAYPFFLPFSLYRLFDRINVAEAQRQARKAPSCPLEVRATKEINAQGASYFAKNAGKIRQDLLRHGAVWFRGFDLMRDVPGYRAMHEALGLQPCLDPLHSSGLRKFASERDALYEEVSRSPMPASRPSGKKATGLAIKSSSSH
jgi:hypothetical protein